jgi:hypothetical protein
MKGIRQLISSISHHEKFLSAYFSGQIQKHQWINTSIFVIPSSRIDQELNLTVHSLLTSTNEDLIDCHLRLHLHGSNKIHSHAQWQHSLRSSLPKTLTVPLIA